MARVAWTGRLRPDRIDDHVAAHAAVWPRRRVQAAGLTGLRAVFRLD